MVAPNFSASFMPAACASNVELDQPYKSGLLALFKISAALAIALIQVNLLSIDHGHRPLRKGRLEVAVPLAAEVLHMGE